MNDKNGNNGLSAVPNTAQAGKWQNLEVAQDKLTELFSGMVEHNGFSELHVRVKLLKKGRKDVVMSSGKDYHFVLKPVQAPAEKGNPDN